MKKKSRDTRKAKRSQPAARDALDILQHQKIAFEKKFGRPPGPKDPVFFDPDTDQPTKLSIEKFDKDVFAAMQAAGVPQQIVYAYKKTGMLLTEERMSTYPADQRAEWEAAIDEYFEMEAKREHSDASPDDGDGPKLPPTEIDILKSMPLSGKERQLVADSLFAIDNVLSGPVTARTRLEIACMLLASACGAAFDSAIGQGHPEEAETRYHLFVELAVLRARELFEGRQDD